MQGYKFNTKDEALIALNKINSEVIFPEGSKTSCWTAYGFAEFNNPQFYYIVSESFTDTILEGKENIELIKE